jgi:bifunctional DNA-binding transcriptional regulator/antitoxin component of YhaV-PrlF toxin-antitoxin module
VDQKEPEAKNRLLLDALPLHAISNLGALMSGPIITISPDNHIDLPEEVRKDINWQPGQELMVIRRGLGIFLCPLMTAESVSGMFPGSTSEGYRDIVGRY